MDIQVGDKITYEFEALRGEKNINKRIINDIADVNMYTNNELYEILKIERPKYEEVDLNGVNIEENEIIYEKKKLLTKEEKNFLEQFIKISDYIIDSIKRSKHRLNFYINNYLVETMEVREDYYKNFEYGKVYTLKELGLRKN